MKNNKIIIWIIKIFIIWRGALFFLAWLGEKILPFKHSFPYLEETLKPYGSFLFWSWANFDGVHYLGIAQKGYFAQYTQAFFPGYPLLVRFLNYFLNNLILSGLLVSNLSLILFLYIFYKLIAIDYSDQLAKRTIVILLCFPTSFFLGSFYSEAFFLFLIISSFYFLRKKNYFLGGIFGFFASLTRLFGVLITPIIIYELFLKENRKKRKIINFLFSLLPVAGLGAYMYYLQLTFSDPLYFVHSQPAFGASRSVNKIILLYQVFYRYLKMLAQFNFQNILYYTVFLEFASALLFLILIILGYFKKIRTSYIIFSILSYIIPTLTGTFSSMPRYVLILFPCFLVLAMIENKIVKNLIYLFFFFLFCFSTILFTRGYWIG